MVLSHFGNNNLAKTMRYELLDTVRGIALLGVLLANMQWHSYFGYLTETEQTLLPFSYFNSALSFLMTMFVDGKFYAIFSLLFGIGFSLIIIKKDGNKIMPKRLAVLLLFGLVHSIFIWEGDILILYALLGLTLPLFNKMRNRALLITAFALLLSPIALNSMRMMSDSSSLPEKAIYAKYDALLLDEYGLQDTSDSTIAKWQKQGDWTAKLQYNYAAMYYHWAYYIESNRVPKVLGMFILGLLIGRNKLFANTDDYLQPLRKIRNIGLTLGIPASAYYAYQYKYVDNPPAALEAFVYVFSVFPLAFAYVAILTLFYQSGRFTAVFNHFANVGKLALTMYLTQSIIGSVLFHGVGLGLAADFAYLPILSFALMLFAMQMVVAGWWLKHYRFGPFEWVWRQLTYGKRLPIKQ